MTASVATTPNADQSEFWNTEGGAKWVVYQDRLDTLMAGVAARLLARAAPGAGERVLEVGCGTGALAMALASAVAPSGSVVAVDISRQLLARARERAAAAGAGPIEFLEADAQTHAFAAGAFDLLVSRFGVMFFDDPVAAFANLGRALGPGGRAGFVAWAGMAGNPWFTIPLEAAVARLGAPPPPPPRAPGPLAFAEHAYVLDILGRAGFADAAAEEEEVTLELSGGVEAAAVLASNLGPASRIVREMGGGPEDTSAIAQEITKAFAAYSEGDTVRVPATLNFYAAVKR
jgi:SAM-dependent methyltransferase